MRQKKPVGQAVGRAVMRLAGWVGLVVWVLHRAAAVAAQEGPAAITVERAGLDAGEPVAITITFPYGCPVLRFPAPPRQQGHDFVLLVEATPARCDEKVTQQAFTATIGPLGPGSYTVHAKKLDGESVIASATFEVAAAPTDTARTARTSRTSRHNLGTPAPIAGMLFASPCLPVGHRRPHGTREV